MSEEKGGDAKWSSEFFNFLRLFDRFGTRVVGLLVLQLAWAVAVTIIPKHTPEHGPARISVPRWGPDFPWVLHPIPIGVVYAEGVVIVFALWMLRSRAYLIVVRPLTTLFRALAAMSLGVVSLFAGVTLGLALCVEFRLRKSRPPAWRSAIKKAVEETRRKAPRRQQGTHPRSRTPRRFCDRCSHRLDVFANLDRGSPWFFADRVGEMCERLDAWILRRLISVGYIGIAPIASVSLEEDEKAAKAAMQNFAQALARLRLLLRSLPTSPYVRFIAVPPALSASVVQRADRLRRVLGLDALLYGSYQSVEPPRIWMNLARPIPPPKWISGKGTALAVADPIEVDPSIRFSMALIDQRDPFDAYIVLSLALAETLRSRQLRWLIDDSFRGKLLRYAPLIYSVSFNDESDPLSSSRKDRLAIVGHLVEDVLLQVPQPSGTPPNEAMRLAEALRRQDDSPETVIFPTAKRVLLEFVLE